MQAENFADWLQGMMTPLGILIGIALVAWAGLYFLSKAHAWRLARERVDYDEDTFARDMAQQGLDPLLARSVYAYLRDVQKIAFPMMPEDTLDERLGIADRDLEDTILQCLLDAGREARPGLTVLPPATLEDLVRYVQDSPRLADKVSRPASGVFPMQRENVHVSGTVRRSRVEPR
ncbi:MAG: hypothetical protein ACYCSN_19665 [Acidobacteriaceae bacterium]